MVSVRKGPRHGLVRPLVANTEPPSLLSTSFIHSFIRFLGATLLFLFAGSLKYFHHIFCFCRVYLLGITAGIHVSFWCLMIISCLHALSRLFSICLNIREKLLKIHQVSMNLKYWIFKKSLTEKVLADFFWFHDMFPCSWGVVAFSFERLWTFSV